MKRQRGRNNNRRNNNNNNNNNQAPNPNRSLDSNGPDVKIRGSANTIYEKYTAMARDAKTSGNRVKAENYLQHAEHYLRLHQAVQAKADAHKAEKEAARLAREEQRQQQQKSQNTEGGKDEGESQPHAIGRNRSRRSRDDAPKPQEQAHDAAAASHEQPADGLEVVTPSAEELPAVEATEAPKTSRRKRAPARKKEDSAPEAVAE